MAKGFASTSDMTEKKIAFTEIGTDLYAFTAEGDPNSAVIVGDDGCLVFDAQATPAMASKVIERVRAVTNEPIKYVVLSHYHAVRVLAPQPTVRRRSLRPKRRGGWSPSAANRTGIPNSAAFRACSRMRSLFPASHGRH